MAGFIRAQRTIALALLACAGAYGQTVRIGVFTLFHPTRFTVRPGSAEAVSVTGSVTRLLEGRQFATFDGASWVTISSRSGGAVDLILAIPGKIERRFHGVVRIRELSAVVELDREIAVASVVAAELPANVPMEALKAQAIVARSFLAASRPRHTGKKNGFDFCDTTHCQFLRAWPDPGNAPRRAAEQTQGFMLSYQGVIFAPLYSAACGGHTLAADEEGYRYQSIPCTYCLRHPNEPVRGHQTGMCQLGASAMAAAGASFRQILQHYFPGTAVLRPLEYVLR